MTTDRRRKEEPALIEAAGPARGPSFGYRDARIDCHPGGHVCRLVLEGHPFDGHTFGSPGTITPLVDLWLDERRLPDHYRAVRKGPRQAGKGPPA